jgi:pimeloyl-ACP methyl ester carboxylesterase
MSQRLRLHYVDWGNPEAPPLVMVHGGRDHCRNWDWTAERLRKDWHVIAPDLRGHGDSAWSPDGDYSMAAFIYDLAQLIHQLELAPVTLLAHSLGGNIALRYTGLFPEAVRKLAVIEGAGFVRKDVPPPPPVDIQDRLRKWIKDKRAAAGRLPRRYATLDDALARMKAENGYLSDAQARHLTLHGANRNEDGTWSWKFDNYLNIWGPYDIPQNELERLWRAITCPVLLLYGKDSFFSSPASDGRLAHFQQPKLVEFEQAGHWLHHDQFERFVSELNGFLPD